MEFFIKKNATLPVLKMQIVKDGRSGYLQLMQDLEVSIIFFTMVEVETGIPKIVSAPAEIVNLILRNPLLYIRFYICNLNKSLLL
jgi:hypothetical protein